MLADTRKAADGAGYQSRAAVELIIFELGL